MAAQKPLVGVIMGSKNDLGTLDPALDLFEKWGVPYEVIVASAHRVPTLVVEWVSTAEARGIQVIIAAAGVAAHLPGVVASKTILPVIGVPVEAGPLSGQDALYSIVQMPPGIPVATVGIGNGTNAAMLALHILARLDNRWRATLIDYRSGWASKIDQQNVELRNERPNAVPYVPSGSSSEPAVAPGESRAHQPPYAPDEEEEIEQEPVRVREIDLTQPLAPEAAGAELMEESGAEIRIAGRAKPRLRREPQYVGRVHVESEFLPVEIAEQATDLLLDGGILAIPTDTVYGLAVDATNPAAVEALYGIKGRSREKAIPVFIESQRQLASLVKNLTTDVKRMLEAFWPGPLTVVFERRGEDLAAVAQESPTIGLRMPDHSITLSLLQELHRPMACTSANPSGAPAARSADEIEQYLGRSVHMILDAGKLPRRPTSTVVSVVEEPYRILREGAISRDELAAVLGDLLQEEDED